MLPVAVVRSPSCLEHCGGGGGIAVVQCGNHQPLATVHTSMTHITDHTPGDQIMSAGYLEIRFIMHLKDNNTKSHLSPWSS